MNSPTLTPRELATVLAALRFWQLYAQFKSWDEHFEDHAPLDLEEIGQLCEKLNR